MVSMMDCDGPPGRSSQGERSGRCSKSWLAFLCQVVPDGKQGDMAAIEVVNRTAAFRSAAVTRKGQRARVCSMGPADGLRQTSTQLGSGTVRSEQNAMPPTLRHEKRCDRPVAKCHHR